MRRWVLACVVLPVAAACPSSSAAASIWSAYDLSGATSGTLAAGRPAPFTDPVSGQVLAFADSPGGHLIEFAGTGAGPVNAIDVTPNGGQTITGDPAPIVDPQNGELLVADDSPNGHLLEFARAPSGAWSVYDLTTLAGGDTITGDPATIIDPQNGQLLVVADSPNGHVIEFARATTGVWKEYDLTALAANAGAGTYTIAGDPAPVIDPQNRDLVVVARTGGHIVEFNRDSSSFVWTPYDLTNLSGGPSVSGDPVPAVNPSGGDLVVFARGSGGQLLEFDRAAGSFHWSYDDLTSATSQPVTGDPDPAVDLQTGGLVAFAESPSEHLVEFADSGGSWSANDLTATAGAPDIAAEPQVLRSPQSGDLLVYVTTPGEHVVELDRSQPAPPTQSTPVPVSVPPPRARGRVRVRISITWTWRGTRTRIEKVRLGGLRPGATVRFDCAGRGCPWRRARSAPRRRVQRLLRSLEGDVLHAGDRLEITIREPGLIAERARMRIRDGRLPSVARL